MLKYIFILIFFTRFSTVFFQPLPEDYFQYNIQKLHYDAGLNWNSLTAFGPIRLKKEHDNDELKRDSLPKIKGRLGFTLDNNSYWVQGNTYCNYKNYFGYFYPGYKNKKLKFDSHYIEEEYINNERHRSGLGYESNWVLIQISRGNENWGAGNDIQLALSQNSDYYDYFTLASDYGNIRVKYIYGFLENTGENINRYITARGIEWTNLKSLIIALSETVIYSGQNRFFDIGYLNPISTHLETELNKRLNILGDNYSNAVWQIHLDFLLNSRIRLSGNYLFDEFVLDPNIELGKEHGKAYSYRLAYTPILSNSNLITLYLAGLYVGTPTFRHGYGMNNFIQNGYPLGWFKGSDGHEISFGLNYSNQENLVTSISAGFFQTGEENLVNRPFDTYADYQKGSFPSGRISTFYYFNSLLRYWLKEYCLFSMGVEFSQNLSADNKVNVILGLQVFNPFNFKIK